MKVYLFQRARSKITHAIKTKWGYGLYEIDKLFGGGFFFVCTNRRGEGTGILSREIMSTSHVTCKRCLAKLKKQNIPIGKKKVWLPKIC